MTLRDPPSERIVIGSMTLAGFILVAETILILFAFGKSVPDGIASGITGVFGTAVGLIMGGVFRNDRTDQQRAETQSTAVAAMAAQMPATPPANPAPTPTPQEPVT